jgi:hypothetical protein
MRLAVCLADGFDQLRRGKRSPAQLRGTSAPIERRLPGRRETQVGVAIAIPVVVNVETISVEVTDVDVVTVRVDIFAHSHP